MKLFIIILGIILIAFYFLIQYKKRKYRYMPLFFSIPKRAKTIFKKYPNNKKYINIDELSKIIDWPPEEIKKITIMDSPGEYESKYYIIRPFNKSKFDKKELKFLLKLLYSENAYVNYDSIVNKPNVIEVK